MKRKILLFLLIVITKDTYAELNSCSEHFYEGKVPIYNKILFQKKNKKLCFEAFAVLHSGISKTPLWAAEYLSKKKLNLAKKIKRANEFHSEKKLPKSHRAFLRDYSQSGFDRGHMAASANMPTRKAQYESFSLSNVVPQNSENNQDLWSKIEINIRNFVKKYGEIYVISGPIFEGVLLKKINGRVLVPTHLFKIIFYPKSKKGVAIITLNDSSGKWKNYSIYELESQLKINFFPSLTSNEKKKFFESNLRIFKFLNYEKV